MPDAKLLAGAAALFGVGAAGLGVPAPTPRVARHLRRVEHREADPQWPDLLHRWLATAHRGKIPVATTAEFVGSGRIRLGRSPWLPVSYRTSHALGREFVADVAATWFGRPVVRGIDAYVDGRGVTKARETVTVGPGLDSSCASFLWSEAFLTPTTWGMDGVKWTQTDATTLTLEVSNEELASPVSAIISCDRESGLPEQFRVPWRPKNAQGTAGAQWAATFEQWRAVGSAWAPELIEVAWLDEERPWFRMRMEPVALNVDVSAALDPARDLLHSQD